MSRTAIITIILLLTILLIVGFYAYYASQKNVQTNLENSPVSVALTSSSTTSFTDFGGNDANLEQYFGQILIVNSWASWAPSSVTELQLLTKVAKEYQEEQVVVIAINRAESKRIAQAFLASLGLQDSVQLIVDTDDQYYKAIGGYTMPETVFYDTDGGVVSHKRGALSEVEIRLILEQLINAEN